MLKNVDIYMIRQLKRKMTSEVQHVLLALLQIWLQISSIVDNCTLIDNNFTTILRF